MRLRAGGAPVPHRCHCNGEATAPPSSPPRSDLPSGPPRRKPGRSRGQVRTRRGTSMRIAEGRRGRIADPDSGSAVRPPRPRLRIGTMERPLRLRVHPGSVLQVRPRACRGEKPSASRAWTRSSSRPAGPRSCRRFLPPKSSPLPLTFAASARSIRSLRRVSCWIPASFGLRPHVGEDDGGSVPAAS